MRPICAKCRAFMRPKRNGVYWTETLTEKRQTVKPSEFFKPENFKPYKVWAGDLWNCLGCETEIIIGVPSRPIVEHFEANFAEIQKELGADEIEIHDFT